MEMHLTEEIRSHFKQYICEASKGNVEIELWRPYWISDFDVDPFTIFEDFAKWKDLPLSKAILDEPQISLDVNELIPPLNSLTSVSLSPKLRNHVLDGLLATAFVLRRFDGDLLLDSEEVLAEFVSVSSILSSSDTRALTVDEIVSVFLEKAITKTSFNFCIITIYDVICILNMHLSMKIYHELLLLLESYKKFVNKKQRNYFRRLKCKTMFFASLSQELMEQDFKELKRALTNRWTSLCANYEESMDKDTNSASRRDLFCIYNQSSKTSIKRSKTVNS